MCTDNDDYKFNLAMCFYKSCDYTAAMKATYAVSAPGFEEKVSDSHIMNGIE